MRSEVASKVSAMRAARLAAMTPAERVALARRLGDEGIASYMAVHGVERFEAIARIKATRRLGRRHSRCSLADEP